MVDLVTALQLSAGALGALGGGLLFMEFFQLPSYLNYEADYDSYNLEIAPEDAREHTWLGRSGALLVSIAFALQFVATLL